MERSPRDLLAFLVEPHRVSGRASTSRRFSASERACSLANYRARAALTKGCARDDFDDTNEENERSVMARVNVDQCAFTDARFARLAELCELADPDHARGKMLRIWAECVNRSTHVLPVWLIEHHLGVAGASRLVLAELAEPADIDAAGYERVRIRGTAGRTDYLNTKRKAAILGGKARAASQRGQAGKFERAATSQPDAQPMAGDVRCPPTLTPVPTLTPAPALTELPRERGSPSVESSRSKAPKKRKTKSDEPPPEGYVAAVDAYHVAYAAAYGGAKPTFEGRQGAIVKRRLADGLDVFLDKLHRMYSSPPEWLKPPYDLITLDSNWDRLVAVPHVQRGVTGRHGPEMNDPNDDNNTPPWELP